MLRELVIITALAAGLVGADAMAAQPVGLSLGAASTQSDRYTAGEARQSRESGEIVPARRVISEVRRRYPTADIQDVELERGRSPRYIVKVLTNDGRRIDVIADARTGRIISER